MIGDDESTAEIIEAEGIVMTEIRCPRCRTVFHIDGNCDRELVECPSCEAQLAVTCR